MTDGMPITVRKYDPHTDRNLLSQVIIRRLRTEHGIPHDYTSSLQQIWERIEKNEIRVAVWDKDDAEIVGWVIWSEKLECVLHVYVKAVYRGWGVKRKLLRLAPYDNILKYKDIIAWSVL